MKILAIGDTHEPFSHRDSFEFIKTVYKKFKPHTTILVGDELDHHSFSFHEKEVDEAFSPAEELEKGIELLQRYYKLVPNALVCESNHGSLIYRKAKFHGMPRSVFKSYNDLLKTPKWRWNDRFLIDNIQFVHQVNGNLLMAARTIGRSVVQGHFHTKMGFEYFSMEDRTIFAGFTGCLIDRDQYAFNYAKANVLKPALGCMIIEDGMPSIIPMILDDKGRWEGL